MGVQKVYKDYTIIRSSWWKFWEIDRLEFLLMTNYEDAYEEVEKKTMNGWSCSMVLSSWVIEDVRDQLGSRVFTYEKLAKKAKNLKVRFGTREYHQYFSDDLDFYIIDGGIYFDSDELIKRDKLLSKLGI